MSGRTVRAEGMNARLHLVYPLQHSFARQEPGCRAHRRRRLGLPNSATSGLTLRLIARNQYIVVYAQLFNSPGLESLLAIHAERMAATACDMEGLGGEGASPSPLSIAQGPKKVAFSFAAGEFSLRR